MREVVGDRTVDEVITIGRQEIETEALAKMQALSTKYAVGISIDQVQLKNINPPEPVQVSFNEVNQAQQEKEKLINEARRDYNKVIPLAEGEKDQRISGSAKPTATGSRGSMKRKAMLLASAPYWRNTSRPLRLLAAAFTSRPCRTSCRAYGPRSLSTSRRAAFCHC
jgi:membrane protease subunit HflK